MGVKLDQQKVYHEIHKNEEYRKLVRKDMLGLRKMFKDQTYYKFQEHLLNEAPGPEQIGLSSR